MTRISKQQERRHQSPRKAQKRIIEKTGPKKDNLTKGYKEHINAISDLNIFIPKISQR